MREAEIRRFPVPPNAYGLGRGAQSSKARCFDHAILIYDNICRLLLLLLLLEERTTTVSSSSSPQHNNANHTKLNNNNNIIYIIINKYNRVRRRTK